MDSVFDVGPDDTSNILLTVAVSTTGEAGTAAVQKWDNDPTVNELATSGDKSGNIDRAEIGTAGALRHSIVKIVTILDFNLPLIPDNWKDTAWAGTIITYTFDGGHGNSRSYPIEDASVVILDDQKAVVVTKRFIL